jgi:3-phosphoshikimate 1-carboxyvinyltransferase
MVTVPGDKSISHRAIILAAIARGTSKIWDWLPAGDTLATLDAIQALGIEVQVGNKSLGSWDLTIEGRGLFGLSQPIQALNCRNAGTCMRLLAGLLAGQSFPSVLDGSQQLRKRPMQRIIEPLRQMGANIEADKGRAPLEIQPAIMKGIHYKMPVASAQVKSAILLAGLYAQGETRVHQPGPARDHTERMLSAMGANLVTEGSWITLKPFAGESSSLRALDLTVPGDLSSAAFPLVAAMIVPHSNIIVQGVGQNQTRSGLCEILSTMGAHIEASQERLTGGESVADMGITFDEMHSTDVGGDVVVRAIDEFPVWAVAASQAAGVSELRDAAELRVKEVDRISLLAGELGKMGAQIEEFADGFAVNGPTRLNGAQVDSYGDHRLGMALAVAGLVASGPTTIRNASCIADSFPGFVETLSQLGAHLEWLS